MDAGEGRGGGIFVGECGGEIGGAVVGIFVVVGVGMGMRMSVVSGTSVGELLPFGCVSVVSSISGMAKETSGVSWL